MKILVVLSNSGFFQHFERVLALLAARGNTIELLVHKVMKADRAPSPFSARLAEHGWRVEHAVSSRDGRLLPVIRDLLNYNQYVRPDHPSHVRAEQWRRLLPRPARLLARMAVGRRILGSETARRFLGAVERMIPVDPAIMESLASRKPDVVFASSCLVRGCPGPDYIRAARKLNIASVVCPPSWDNLTTKSALHAIPDLTLVWNEVLLDEAVTLHRAPRDKVFATGAPGLDYWFEHAPLPDRESFCRGVGLDPTEPYVMYLCSSESISGNEVPFVAALISQLHAHPGLEHLQFLIRPHSSSSSDWTGFQAPNARVSHDRPSAQSTAETQAHFRNSLHYACAVIAINTTATLDAACVDRPCIAILSDQYTDSQMRLAHFRILVDGGFLEIGRGASEVGDILLHILDGVDEKAQARREFVTRFVRTPFESHSSASETAALVLEGVARGKSVAELRSAFQDAPVSGR